MDLSTSDGEVQWSTLVIDDRMDFRGPPTTADANRLIFLPPFGPLAARCAFTVVLSIKYKLLRDFAARASKIRFQTPRRDHRLNRLYALVYGRSVRANRATGSRSATRKVNYAATDPSPKDTRVCTQHS